MKIMMLTLALLLSVAAGLPAYAQGHPGHTQTGHTQSGHTQTGHTQTGHRGP